jgi:pimeloyl-ACP methyl ester carboxylesterase
MQSIKTGHFLGRIPYVRVGKHECPILVINGGQGFMMSPSEGRMSKDARRLARVLPGDRSFILLGYDPSAAQVTIDGLADDVAEVINKHFGGAADVVGISYGGVIASRAAARSPRSIRRLVLLASAPWFSQEGKERLRRQIDHVNSGERIALLQEFTSMFRNPVLNFLVGFRIRLGAKSMVARLGRDEVISRYLEAMLESEQDIKATFLRETPTLLVGGTQDQFFAEAMREAAIRLPHIKTLLLEKETHMVPIERAKA